MPEQARRALWLAEDRHAVDGVERGNPAGLFDAKLPDLIRQIFGIVCGNGVALIDPTAAARMGLPTGELPSGGMSRTHTVAVELRNAGYVVKEVHRWFLVTHRDIPGDGVWFGLTEFIDLEYCQIIGETPADTTAALSEWHQITGHVWTGGAADAGNVILRAQRYRATRGGPELKPEFWSWVGPEGEPYESAYLQFQWQRPVEGMTKAYGYDRVRAYLSAMTTTEVAAEPLTHDGLTEFDPKRSGWWLVELGEWELGHALPDPAGYSFPDDEDGNPSRTGWLSTPTVDLLAELAADGLYSFRVLDSWTAPSTPIMRTYGTQLRKVWDVAGAISNRPVRKLVRAAVKGAYRMGHGHWRSKQSTVQRPDWSAAVTAQSRSNLWRRLWALWFNGGNFGGPLPVRIDTDNVFFPEPIGTPDGWTIWDGARKDLDEVSKLGHWRTAKVKEIGRKASASVEGGQQA